jgi:hypothetical protein
MSSSTPDLKLDVHHYWTPTYAIVEMKLTRDSLRFYRCARIDEDVLVVENILLLNRHGGPRSNPVDKQHEVQKLLGVELDVSDGDMDARIPISPVEVCTRLSRELGSDAVNRPPPESDEDVVSMFSKAHLRACHAHMTLKMLAAGMVGKEVSMDMYQVDRMFRMRDGVSLHKHPRRRMVGYADIFGIRRKWTRSDDRWLEENLTSLLAVRRLEVTW